MMTLARLRTLLSAYGADPVRWPEDERDAARALIAESADARAAYRQARDFDALLDKAPLQATPNVEATVLASRIAGSAVPRRIASATGLNALAARWSFGWPNFAALAAAGIAGFVVGWMDLGPGPSLAAEFDADIPALIAPIIDFEDLS
jgi:hypothetical protein